MDRAEHLIAMNEEFTLIRFHQGIEGRPISRLSGGHQCDLGWSLHRGTCFSCFKSSDPVILAMKWVS